MKNKYNIKDYLVDFEFNQSYHLFSRTISGVKLFENNRERVYFEQKVEEKIGKYARISAYCYLSNHFHFVIHLKDPEEIMFKNPKEKERAISDTRNFLSYQLRGLMISVAKKFNANRKRRGAFFDRAFKRVKIKSKDHAKKAIVYIHRNPIHHNVVKHYGDWPHSSYKLFYNNSSHFMVSKTFVEKLFTTKEGYVNYHRVGLKKFLNKKEVEKSQALEYADGINKTLGIDLTH